jgi:hypothetical protein
MCTLLYFELRSWIFVLLAFLRLCFFKLIVPENDGKAGLLLANFLRLALMFLEMFDLLSFEWRNDPWDYVGCIKQAHLTAAEGQTRFTLVHDSFIVDYSSNVCFKIHVSYGDNELFTRLYVHSTDKFSLAKLWVNDRFHFAKGTETIHIVSQEIRDPDDIFDKLPTRNRHVRICLSKKSLFEACKIQPGGTVQSAWNNAVKITNEVKKVVPTPTEYLKKFFGRLWIFRWFLVCMITTVIVPCKKNMHVKNIFQRIVKHFIGWCFVLYLLLVLGFENFWLELVCSCILPMAFFCICWMLSEDIRSFQPKLQWPVSQKLPHLNVMYFENIHHAQRDALPVVDAIPMEPIPMEPIPMEPRVAPPRIAQPAVAPPRIAQPRIDAIPMEPRVALPGVNAPMVPMADALPGVDAIRLLRKRRSPIELQELGNKRQTRRGRIRE